MGKGYMYKFGDGGEPDRIILCTGYVVDVSILGLHDNGTNSLRKIKYAKSYPWTLNNQ